MSGQSLQPGDRVAGRYQLLAALGEGGMAVVFEALDEVLQRRVALKILRRSSDVSTARFEREARAASALNHPSVVRVYGFGQLSDGRPYLALELIDGESLADLLHRERSLAADRALTLLLPVVGALAEAHAAGIIHRDIKPSNLLVQKAPGQPETLRLLDFGIASWNEPDARRLTRTGEVFGTPEFMAPEQAMSRPVSPATDVWAVGAVLHELLSGQSPFAGTSHPSVLYKVVNEPPPGLPASVPSEVVALVMRCLSKGSAQRPADATVLLREMEALLLPARRELASSRPPNGPVPMRPSTGWVTVPPRATASLGTAPTAPSAPPAAAPVKTTNPSEIKAIGETESPTLPSLRRSTRGTIPLWVATLLMVALVLGVWWVLRTQDVGIRGRAAAGSVALAGSQTPETAGPETAAPETAAPQTAAPETAAPETAAPETAPAGLDAGLDAAPAVADAAPAVATAGAAGADAAPAVAPDAGAAPDAHPDPDAGDPRPAEGDPLAAVRALRGNAPAVLAWLQTHPRAGTPGERLQIEFFARMDRHDMLRVCQIVPALLALDPALVNGSIQARLLAGLPKETYWKGLVPVLADPRLYPRVAGRLMAMTRSEHWVRTRALQIIVQANGDRRLAKTNMLLTDLEKAETCAVRKNAIQALGRSGHAMALPALAAERKGSNGCMGSAIDDAVNAIREQGR